MKFYLGDVVRLKKPHACGRDEWEVLRTGMDFRIKCLGCSHVVMLPRSRFEKSVKELVHRAIDERPGDESPQSSLQKLDQRHTQS